jgi:hypothetical protein
MASENIGSLYPTQIPGYEDAADIQAALRVYHYGSDTYEKTNNNPDQIPPNSVAGNLKRIDDELEALDLRGIGSDYLPDAPLNPVDGYIWVDADSAPTGFAGKQWVLHDSGTLSGTFFETAGLNGETHKIIFKDYETSNYFDLEVRVNNVAIVSAEGRPYPDIPNTTLDSVVSIDLANTTSSIKPTTFGNFKNTDIVESFRYELTNPFEFITQYENEAARDLAIPSPTQGQRAITLEDSSGNPEIIFWSYFSSSWRSYFIDVDNNNIPLDSLDAPEFSAGTYEVWSYR